MKDFGKSWRSGVVFHSVIYAIRPDLVDMDKVRMKTNRENLEDAFTIAEKDLGIPRLLDPEGMIVIGLDNSFRCFTLQNHHRICIRKYKFHQNQKKTSSHMYDLNESASSSESSFYLSSRCGR